MMMESSADVRHLEELPELIPARMLNEFAYCPRLAYLEWVQGEFADNLETIEGRFGHRRVDRPSTGMVPQPPDRDENGTDSTGQEDGPHAEPIAAGFRRRWTTAPSARGVPWSASACPTKRACSSTEPMNEPTRMSVA